MRNLWQQLFYRAPVYDCLYFFIILIYCFYCRVLTSVCFLGYHRWVFSFTLGSPSKYKGMANLGWSSLFFMKMFIKLNRQDEILLLPLCVPLILSWRRPLSCRNHSIDLRSKSMEWFLYDNGLRHERVNTTCIKFIDLLMNCRVLLLFWNETKTAPSVYCL